MPRRSRMYLPGFAYHIVQRGNNREACFLSEDCYQLYLELLKEQLSRYHVSLHAYCLMTNHTHLLMTPDCEQGISNVMKVVASRYAYFVNKQYKRSGTMWEGRHKSSAVDTVNYLLKCYRYIELNPVVACMVDRPEEYRWSSYQVNAWGDLSPPNKADFISPHIEYLQLGVDAEQRQHGYRELFKVNLAEEDLHAFRKAAHYSMPVGSDKFVTQIEAKTGRKIGYAKRGRPRSV
jgi:putative transposase